MWWPLPLSVESAGCGAGNGGGGFFFGIRRIMMILSPSMRSTSTGGRFRRRLTGLAGFSGIIGGGGGDGGGGVGSLGGGGGGGVGALGLTYGLRLGGGDLGRRRLGGRRPLRSARRNTTPSVGSLIFLGIRSRRLGETRRSTMPRRVSCGVGGGVGGGCCGGCGGGSGWGDGC